MARTAHRETGLENSAWPAASRSTASATAGCCAKGRSSALDPAGRGRRGRRARRGAADLAPPLQAAAARARAAATAARDSMKGAYLGPRSRPTRSSDVPQKSRRVVRAARAVGGSGRVAELLARREDRRLVQRPHGVRAALARRAQHPRRPAQPADAGADEHQDQVPRGLPAVRAERAARARRATISRWTATRRTCCSSRRSKRERQIPMTDDQQRSCGASTQLNVVRSDIPAVTHIDYSARVQTVSRETQPGLLRPDQGVRGADRVRGAREHVVQRARRADRLHAGGRVPLLHAHAHRLPRAGAVPARQDEAARMEGDAQDWQKEFQLD